MTAQLELFDVVDQEPDVDAEQLLDLEVAAWASCRHCGVLTTAAGLTNRGHDGPTSTTCRVMVARYDLDRRTS